MITDPRASPPRMDRPYSAPRESPTVGAGRAVARPGDCDSRRPPGRRECRRFSIAIGHRHPNHRETGSCVGRPAAITRQCRSSAKQESRRRDGIRSPNDSMATALIAAIALCSEPSRADGSFRSGDASGGAYRREWFATKSSPHPTGQDRCKGDEGVMHAAAPDERNGVERAPHFGE
jgi:hypothetical protein